MLPKIDTSISNTGGLTNRDTSFLDKLKTQGYSESSRYDLLNKARQKNGLPPIQGPVEDKGFLGTIKQQAGEIGSQIIGGIKSIPKSTGLIGKTWGDFQERAANIDRNNDTMPLGDRRTTRNIGQYLGAANDLFGNVVGSGIKTFVPKSLRDSTKDMARLGLKTEPGEAVKDTATKAYEQWKQFEKANPELAKDLGAVGNIANFALNFVGGGQAGKIKPTGMIDDAFNRARSSVDDMAGRVAPSVQKFASNVPENASKLGTGTAEVGISAASGVSREAQQIIKQQPGLYQQARQGSITREAVTDDVVSALGKRMDDISELGKGYETIRTSSVKVPKSDIAKITKQHLDELKVSKIDLPLGDRTTVQKALDYIAEYPDTLSAQNALSLRRKFDDLINWKSEATGEGKRIIKGLRAKIDDYLGEKIPGLKTLDKQYGPEREFIDKVRSSILDKQGNLKENAISTVSNMVGKGKELKLDRFEKLLPGIGDKVRALKAFEEIQNLAQIKTGAVARQVFSFAVGGVPGFVATNPYVVGYALEKYGFAKQAIKNLLAKGKNISQAEQNAVKKAVKGVSVKEAEKVIASKVGTPLLTAGKSSAATGSTGGKLPPVDLKPNASTGTAGTSQARISPPQTAGLLDSPKKTISDKVSGTVKPKTKPVVKSAGNKVNEPIIQKLAKKQETPKTPKSDYLSTTEAKMTDTELKSLAKKYLESSKLPVGKGRVSSDNMADYKGYARIRDYFKSQGDDSLLESKLPKTPMKTEKTSETLLNEYDSIKKEIDSLRENAMKKIKNGEDTGDLIPRIKELQTKEESIYNEYKSKRNIEEGLDESNRKIESDKVIEDKKITEMKKSEETDLRGFTDNMSPMEKGKAISLLTNKRVMYKGKAMTLRDAFEKKLEDGWKLSDNGLIFRNPEYLSHTVDVGTPVNKTESAYIKYISKSDTPKTPQVEGKTDEYFYHGTGPLAFEQIQKEGIKPQRRGVSSFSKTEEYSRNWAYPEATGVKGAMLRVKKSYMEGKLFNTKKPRPKSDELYEVLTKETIPPEALEVLKDGKWQPLVKPKPSLPLSSKSEVKYSKPDSLVQEAKKYKSAEEFVKAQGEPLYHGTNADFEQFSVKGGKRATTLAEENVESQGSFFTDNKDVAELYSKSREGGKPRVIEAYVPMENTLDISDLRNAPKLLDDILRIGKDEGIYVSNIEDYWQLLDNKKIADFIKSKGYDSVKISEIDPSMGEHFSYFSLYPDKIKTKQQLVDIFNKYKK